MRHQALADAGNLLTRPPIADTRSNPVGRLGKRSGTVAHQSRWVTPGVGRGSRRACRLIVLQTDGLYYYRSVLIGRGCSGCERKRQPW